MRAPLTIAAAVVIASTASAQTLYSTDFTDLSGWTTIATGAAGFEWTADATPATHCAGPFMSPPHSLNFNDGVSFGDDIGGAYGSGIIRSPEVDLELTTTGFPVLTFWASWFSEPGCEWDALVLRIEPQGGGTPFYEACINEGNPCEWHRFDVPMEAAWGKVEIVFDFDPIDAWWNDMSGPFIDDLQIRGAFPLLCSPAEPHYQGGSVTLSSSSMQNGGPGLTSLRLEATGGPSGEFGFFFIGPGFGPEISVFNGVHCLSQPTGRYNSHIASNQGIPQLNSLGQFDAGGVLQNLAGTSAAGTGFDVPLALPYAPVGQQIGAGDTWYFQLWYRDQDELGNPSANFSDAVAVNFD